MSNTSYYVLRRPEGEGFGFIVTGYTRRDNRALEIVEGDVLFDRGYEVVRGFKTQRQADAFIAEVQKEDE